MADSNEDPGTPISLPAGTAVAVTGATGFIGRRLVERLAEAGASVRCLLRVGTQSRPANGVEHRILDLSDPEQVREALSGIDIVFHCAFDWNDELWNFGALRSLIGGCRANACRRLVHVSSFVVYEIPEHGNMTEEAPPTRATSGYPHVKLELERELLRAIGQGEVSATIVQPTIVYGPGSKPWTIDPADMLRHGTVVLPDQGQGTCNAVYVDDVVGAMILAGVHPAASGRRFLVSGPAVTWKQFYEGIAAAAGARPPECRPAVDIAREFEPRRKLVNLVSSPERVLRRLAFVGPVRKAVWGVTERLPSGSRHRLRDRLYGPETRWPGHVHLPDPGRVRFLQGTATIDAGRARRELGYAPQYNFERGLIPVSRFLSGAR